MTRQFEPTEVGAQSLIDGVRPVTLGEKLTAISQLHISELNMRHSETAPEIDDILPSVKERGIRQPLIVRREGGTAKKPKYGIVAGRRRHFCLAAIAAEGVDIADVPCCVMDAKDDALAIETSIIENVARLAPTEMEQYEAFSALAEKGQSVDDIAAVFGITANSVKRRLALGSLIPDVREAYSNQQIDAASIRVLTMATEEQQAAWLELFNSDDYCPTGTHQLKAWLTGGGVITTDKALFSVADYTGTILTDLFGEHGQFADVEHFWESQNAAIAKSRRAIAAKFYSMKAISQTKRHRRYAVPYRMARPRAARRQKQTSLKCQARCQII